MDSLPSTYKQVITLTLEGYRVKEIAEKLNVRTWWSAESGNAGEHFVMNFGKKVQINSVQIN